ncbi:pteridine reductase 1 [Leptomonas pyrrhocoris]|uniref:Pteridine reductase 1 n=1 Tax=Leptomonas pyrrhocoris TaxID=157538 RepID=A0A0M9G7A6_LEPPY|nr:pteridine reductase 1 [Leptomonas pyrrhocoris]XP_015662550.1 pteridine reductase 1 [Leptomonas pyrrhocoris]KPA84110.1 pteridine reductase 1 [Leptomonas pyrrhocoris]KPA84111.1 pteridine reductase 1 [Leptomonas pyrrhocoris]|eukprot:XP_015662549.1 pteridine reductase 1 [Leptomonas pyrrhocoris]
MSLPYAPVALVTGAAIRIGRGIAEGLHVEGYSLCIHYHNSKEEATSLAAVLNARRENSAMTLQADLSTVTPSTEKPADAAAPLFVRCAALIDGCYAHWGRCDVLVNNASAYYPTPLLTDAAKHKDTVAEESAVETAASELFGSNAIAPYYLTRTFAQRVADTPAEQRGTNYSIVNLVDAMANQPLLGFTAYTMGKAALEALTRSAALELAPLGVRVNGVGPGLSVLAVNMPEEDRVQYRSKVPLHHREASAKEIGDTVVFLCSDRAMYITGATINVDGGWSLTRS